MVLFDNYSEHGSYLRLVVKVHQLYVMLWHAVAFWMITHVLQHVDLYEDWIM